jgi:formamidopyrimidine-DNA glycosylase
MPELPEVETVMRGLQAVLEGERIAWAETRRDGMRFPFPPRLAARLRGRRVLGFRRRAKYILMRLEGGESLLIHLGMSGRMVARREGAAVEPRQGKQGAFSDARGHNAPPEAHEHLAFGTEGGWHIGFVDPRRFGSVDLVATDAEDHHKLLAGLGPEPLGPEITPAWLSAALTGKRTPIKSALLDQRVIAGLGNIYVCEALYRAGISPRRSAHQGRFGRGDCRRRVESSGLCARRWRDWSVSGEFRGLWSGRGSLPRLSRQAGMPGHQADCAIRAVQLFLPHSATLKLC